MAKAVTEEQAQLRRRARRRLIGALALATVIAVILPWVLESEPRQGDQDVSIQIPSPDSSAFRSKVVPGKPAEPEKSAATAAKPADAEARPSVAEPPSDALQSEQDKLLSVPTPKAVTPKPPAPKDTPAVAALEAKKKPQVKSESAVDGKRYVVQVTALADADKAQGIQKELAAKGLKAYTEKVTTASGEVTRVRIGPYPNREAAEKERARIKSFGFDGNVVPR